MHYHGLNRKRGPTRTWSFQAPRRTSALRLNLESIMIQFSLISSGKNKVVTMALESHVELIKGIRFLSTIDSTLAHVI